MTDESDQDRLSTQELERLVSRLTKLSKDPIKFVVIGSKNAVRWLSPEIRDRTGCIRQIDAGCKQELLQYASTLLGKYEFEIDSIVDVFNEKFGQGLGYTDLFIIGCEKTAEALEILKNHFYPKRLLFDPLVNDADILRCVKYSCVSPIGSIQPETNNPIMWDGWQWLRRPMLEQTRPDFVVDTLTVDLASAVQCWISSREEGQLDENTLAGLRTFAKAFSENDDHCLVLVARYPRGADFTGKVARQTADPSIGHACEDQVAKHADSIEDELKPILTLVKLHPAELHGSAPVDLTVLGTGKIIDLLDVLGKTDPSSVTTFFGWIVKLSDTPLEERPSERVTRWKGLNNRIEKVSTNATGFQVSPFFNNNRVKKRHQQVWIFDLFVEDLFTLIEPYIPVVLRNIRTVEKRETTKLKLDDFRTKKIPYLLIASSNAVFYDDDDQPSYLCRKCLRELDEHAKRKSEDLIALGNHILATEKPIEQRECLFEYGTPATEELLKLVETEICSVTARLWHRRDRTIAGIERRTGCEEMEAQPSNRHLPQVPLEPEHEWIFDIVVNDLVEAVRSTTLPTSPADTADMHPSDWKTRDIKSDIGPYPGEPTDSDSYGSPEDLELDRWIFWSWQCKRWSWRKIMDAANEKYEFKKTRKTFLIHAETYSVFVKRDLRLGRKKAT